MSRSWKTGIAHHTHVCGVTLWTWVVIATSIQSAGTADDRLPTRVVEGRITNSDGHPIRGANVEWGHFLAEKESREVVKTDATGKYRVETQSVGPDYRLGVSAIGFAPSWRDGLIPPPQESTPLTVDFELAAPITLKGKVVDEDGKPIEGVQVIAQSPTSGFHSSFSMPIPSYPFPGPSREATTNAEGEFSIRYLPATPLIEKDSDKGHPFDVSIKTDSGRMPRGQAFSQVDNKIAISRSYVLPPSDREGKIRGRVLDEVTEQPIENFKVVLRHRAGMREFSSKTGEFLLEQLYANTNTQFFVYAEDHAPFVVQATPSIDGTFVECQLKRKPSLKGIVVDPLGKPVQGAKIVLGFDQNEGSSKRFYWGAFSELVDGFMGLNYVQRGETRADGQFRFEMTDQRPVIAVIAPGFARLVRFLDPNENQDLLESKLQLVLQPECSISGVAKLNGAALPNVELRLTFPANWDLDFGQIKADEQGRFSISNLQSGTFHLSVYQSSGNMMTSGLTKQIELSPGEALRNVVLDNPGGNCSLRGKATPFSMIGLTPTKLDGKSGIEFTHVGAIASPEGDFEIRGLHPGTYTCRVIPVSALNGFVSSGTTREVIVQRDTVLEANELETLPFLPSPRPAYVGDQ